MQLQETAQHQSHKWWPRSLPLRSAQNLCTLYCNHDSADRTFNLGYRQSTLHSMIPRKQNCSQQINTAFFYWFFLNMRKLPPGISPKVLLPRVWHFMRCEGEAEPVSVDQYQSAWLAMLSARGGDGDERAHNLASEAGFRQHECVDEA